MDHPAGATSPTTPSSMPSARSAALGVAVMLGAIAAFYLLREHWTHLAGQWAYLLLLACPLMHLIMHRGHRKDPDH